MELNEMELKINGLGGPKQTNWAGAILDLEWDFTQYDHIKDNANRLSWLKSFAGAFASTMDAANDLGWIEHTCDWDPFLIIRLRNNTHLETDSHYYQVDEVTDTELRIIAPSVADFKEWEEELPKKYYVPDTENHGAVYAIPLIAISVIKVMY